MRKWRNTTMGLLFSFLLAVLIPASLLGGTFYYKSQTDYLKDLFSGIQRQMDTALHRLSGDILIAKNVRALLEDNGVFYEERLKSSPGSFVYIQQHLATLRQTLSFASEMGFYSAVTDLLYLQEIYSRTFYLESTMMDDKFKQRLSNALQTATLPVFLSKEDLANAPVFLLIPFETNYAANPTVRSQLVFRFDWGYFPALLQFTQEYQTSIARIWYQGQTVYQSRVIDEQLIEPGKSDGTVKLDGTPYYRFLQESESVTMELLVPKSSTTAMLRGLVQSFILAVVISITAGSLVILFFVKRYYQPMVSLEKTVNQMSGGSPKTNLFANVDETLNYLMERITSNGIDARREKFLLSLVSGRMAQYGAEQFEKTCTEFKIDFVYSNFICAVIQFQNSSMSLTIPNNIDATTVEGTRCFACAYTELNMYILIIACAKPSQKTVESVLAAVSHESAQPDHTLFIGVGTFVTSLNELNRTYLQALQAVDCCQKQNKTTVWFKDVQQNNLYYHHTSLKLIEIFCQSACQGDLQKLQISSQNLQSLLNMENVQESCNTICLEFLFKLQQTSNFILQPLDVDLEDSYKDRFFQNDCSVAECADYINQTELRLAAALKKQRCNTNRSAIAGSEVELTQASQTLSVENIMGYIADNLTDPNMSTTSVADYFNTSQSNLSHFFKKHTSTTISEYINTLKIDLVKKLLIETNYSISDISKTVGYYHPSNFIKKFKSVEGVTPAEYRTKTKDT